ncbi:hypothetical protein [Pseudescherichia vulneris]|uniref:hypothetical protein n=1 Tax=Pseudescherichia vulneris TaxID=566 RepID=UPI0028B1E5DB|nr:hypothetical protein [Pseudescherichia vulneris]
MKIENFAVPITSTGGRLLGVELETRVEINGCRMIIGSGREADHIRQQVHTQQVREVRRMGNWFTKNNLFCVLNTEADNGATDLPFVKYFTTYNDSGSEKIWLDDVGGDLSSTLPLVAGIVEVGRLERRFTEEHINRDIFPIIIKNLHQYCDKLIVPVQNRQYLSALHDAGVWAVQGEYRPVSFSKLQMLM